jgi:hypothetical protein
MSVHPWSSFDHVERALGVEHRGALKNCSVNGVGLPVVYTMGRTSDFRHLEEIDSMGSLLLAVVD